MGKEEGSGGEKKRGGEVGKATWGRVKVLMGKWERQHEKGEGSWEYVSSVGGGQQGMVGLCAHCGCGKLVVHHRPTAT